jgi:glutathione synthase/RimK-type ligase-like ATP-grasp enzyme
MLRRVRGHALGAALAASAEGVLTQHAIGPFPDDAVVPLDQADDVLLLCSRRGAADFHPEAFSHEAAFAHELAARGRSFGVTDDASLLSEKSIAWFHPTDMVRPRLWNYAKQVHQFAAGLEEQGNRVFTSAAEALFWENKGYMHRRLDEVGTPTPRTVLVTAANRDDVAFDIEPVLLKEEHAAGSSGIHHFATAAAARAFAGAYAFRPSESLIMQEIVPGATRDLRLTMVGDRVIESATYWRAKSADALAAEEWVTTATTYGSTVVHEAPPETAVALGAQTLRDLGLRTAGIDLMWVDDDVTATPVMLELSPFYQPNPPKPERYADRSYKAFKARRFAPDGYFYRRHLAHRDISAALLDQGLF